MGADELENGEVELGVPSFHLRVERPLVGELHADLVGIFHDVGVGDDVSMGIDDEPRSERPLPEDLIAASVAAAPRPSRRGKHAERIEAERKVEIGLRSLDVVDRRDVHDRRGHLGDERRNVGRPREHRRRREGRGPRGHAGGTARRGVGGLREMSLAAGADAERRSQKNGT